MDKMNRLSIALSHNKYDIVINDNFSTISNEIQALWSGGKIIIITDDIVERAYLSSLTHELRKMCPIIYSYALPNGEDSKCIDTLNQIYDYLLTMHVDRSDLIIALGGGVVGDIAGYAAATYLRGIAYIQIPTTLLSQIDSSVGGKVAVNYQGYKNMIGAFYQPLLVFINLSVLRTLPDREYKCGLTESVVHALIADSSLLEYTHKNINGLNRLNEHKLNEFIYRNCKIKADIVIQDEKEKGIRKILNFGHTIGHAIEGLYGYKYKHGECVSVGIVAAFKLSVYFRLINAEKLAYIETILYDLGLVVDFIDFDWNEIVKRIAFDKKTISGKVSFILPVDIGKVIVYEVSINNSIAEVLSNIVI
jgi:3-dehydroquinate synthase